MAPRQQARSRSIAHGMRSSFSNTARWIPDKPGDATETISAAKAYSDSNSENENGDNQREGQDTVRIMQLMK